MLLNNGNIVTIYEFRLLTYYFDIHMHRYKDELGQLNFTCKNCIK